MCGMAKHARVKLLLDMPNPRWGPQRPVQGLGFRVQGSGCGFSFE